MTPHRPLRGALLAVLLVLAATAARGETAWDQARVTSLSKSLVGAVDDLYDAFFKQPRVVTTPSAIRNYDRLKREIRHIKQVARGLHGDLQRGEGREDTQKAYESLVSSVNWARERARSVFTTQDVNAKADVARQTLEEIGKYYEPVELVPVQE
ncbi:MAG TPA: hypothetical protein VNE71_00315 [Myxococcota bacterium]|nr:hypothetical protein [Myxococcota bacterium]